MKLKIEIDLTELLRLRGGESLYEALDACFEQLVLDVAQPGAIGDAVFDGRRVSTSVGRWELE